MIIFLSWWTEMAGMGKAALLLKKALGNNSGGGESTTFSQKKNTSDDSSGGKKSKWGDTKGRFAASLLVGKDSIIVI